MELVMKLVFVVLILTTLMNFFNTMQNFKNIKKFLVLVGIVLYEKHNENLIFKDYSIGKKKEIFINNGFAKSYNIFLFLRFFQLLSFTFMFILGFFWYYCLLKYGSSILITYINIVYLTLQFVSFTFPDVRNRYIDKVDFKFVKPLGEII